MVLHGHLLHHRHVGHGGIADGRGQEDAEASLQGRLVPAGERHAGVRRLELGRRHVLLHAVHDVLAAVEALEIVVEDAAELDVERGGTYAKRLLQRERHTLLLLEDEDSRDDTSRKAQPLKRRDLFIHRESSRLCTLGEDRHGRT